MADVLKERSNAVALPSEGCAGVVLDEHSMAPPVDKDGKTWARATALIQGRPGELYALWRDLESTPKWQEMVILVLATGPKTSHWVMNAGGKPIEWDSEILNDEPGRRIAWRSVAGDSNHVGEVVFDPAPGGRGTMVTVFQEFLPGKQGTAAQTIFSRNPKQAVMENLCQFKAYAETLGILRTAGQAYGPRSLPGSAKVSSYDGKIGLRPGSLRKAS